MNAIEIKGLKKSYPGFDLALDLSLPRGSILGLVGENGAGKTTTIKALLGMLRLDAGEICVLGTDNRNRKDFAPVREKIGVVLDEAAFPECLTAEQLGKVMAGIYRSWDSDAYAGYLKTLGIPTGKKFRDFSRGTRMKQSIAVALSHHPELLVLDEPTSGLDPVVRDEGHSVLISSHIVSDLEKLCDYIAFLHKGRLLLFEEKDALREKYALAQMSKSDFAALDASQVIGHRSTPYGVSAILRRDALPKGLEAEPVSIEDLFILMVKEEET